MTVRARLLLVVASAIAVVSCTESAPKKSSCERIRDAMESDLRAFHRTQEAYLREHGAYALVPPETADTWKINVHALSGGWVAIATEKGGITPPNQLAISHKGAVVTQQTRCPPGRTRALIDVERRVRQAFGKPVEVAEELYVFESKRSLAGVGSAAIALRLDGQMLAGALGKSDRFENGADQKRAVEFVKNGLEGTPAWDELRARGLDDLLSAEGSLFRVDVETQDDGGIVSATVDAVDPIGCVYLHVNHVL